MFDPKTNNRATFMCFTVLQQWNECMESSNATYENVVFCWFRHTVLRQIYKTLRCSTFVILVYKRSHM